MNKDVNPRRRYVSPRRREQAEATRQAILDAAHHLFISKGYIGTSIREIAAEAGVAEATVYAAFKDKSSILWAVGERVLTGGEGNVSLSQSDVIQSIRDEPDFQGRLRRAIRWNVNVVEGGIGELEDVIRQAAAADSRYDELLREAMQRKKQDDQMTLGLLLEVAPQRPKASADDLLDLIEAIASPEVYRMLIKERGWPTEKYELWMYEIIKNIFIDDSQ